MTDPFTQFHPLYQRAIQTRNRDRRIPITPSRDGIGGFVKTLTGFAIWFFLLGFAGRILWQVL